MSVPVELVSISQFDKIGTLHYPASLYSIMAKFRGAEDSTVEFNIVLAEEQGRQFSLGNLYRIQLLPGQNPQNYQNTSSGRDPMYLAEEVVSLLMMHNKVTARAALKIAETLLAFRINEQAGWVEEVCREQPQ